MTELDEDSPEIAGPLGAFITMYIGWVLIYPVHLIGGLLLGTSAPVAALLPFLMIGGDQPYFAPVTAWLLEALRLVFFAFVFLRIHEKLSIRRTWIAAAAFVFSVWLGTMAFLVLFNVRLGRIHI